MLQFARERDEVPNRTDTNPEQKQTALTFEKALQKFGARPAFDRLVRKKVDSDLLKQWLPDIATAPDKYGKRTDNKRLAAQLARNARSLATKIDRAAESPPLLFIGTATDLNAMLAVERHRLSEGLREYASCWEKLIHEHNLLSRKSPRGPQSPRTDSIWALLEIVKECTGSYHYPEVADLLNAMDLAYGPDNSDPHWDEKNLGQLQYRARKRMTKVLRD